MSDSLWPHGLYNPWHSPGQNTGAGILSLLRGIFLSQRSNSGLPHCRKILYQLSHKGSPRIEWVAYPFSSRSSWHRNWSRASFIEGGFFTNWAIRERKKKKYSFGVIRIKIFCFLKTLLIFVSKEEANELEKGLANCIPDNEYLLRLLKNKN